MLLKRGDQLPRQLLQVIMDAGGLGDSIARLVAVRESLRLAPYLDLRIFVPNYFKPLVLACTDLKDYLENGRLLVFSFDERAANVNHEQPGVQFSKRTHTPGRLSLVDDGLLTIADTLDTINGEFVNRDYVTIETQCKPYRETTIALTSEATNSVRSMRAEETAKLAKWLGERGHNVILLGSSKDGPEMHGLDLRGETALIEAHAWLACCHYVIGVDNGLMHLAGTIEDGPAIIAGYTSIDPHYREIVRNGAPIVVQRITPSMPGERFCQSQHNFLFGHDFRDCLYGDNAVANQLTADLFIEACKREGL